jgi:hypothetical protein
LFEIARLLLGVDKFAGCAIEKLAEGLLSGVDKLGVLVADKFCVDKFLDVGTFCVDKVLAIIGMFCEDKLPDTVDEFGVDPLFLTVSKGGSSSLNW